MVKGCPKGSFRYHFLSNCGTVGDSNHRRDRSAVIKILRGITSRIVKDLNATSQNHPKNIKHESEETQKKQRTREQQKHQRPYYLFLGNYNTFIPTKHQLYKKAPVRTKSLLSRWRMSRALFRSWSLTYIDDHRPLEILTGHVGPLRFGGNRGTDVLHMEKPLRGRKKHLRWVGRYARTRRYNVSLRWIRLQSAL